MGTTTKRQALIIRKLLFYWPIFAIFGIWFVFASPYFLKGLIPFPSKYLVTFFPPWSAAYAMPVKNNAMPDVATQIYPWKKLTIDMWRNGQIPLWNPFSFSGTPHAANYQTAVFSPFNLLFFVFPFVDAWSILVLLQPLLAGLFMYIFLRSLDRSRESSFVGSIAFMFCGFIVVWMAYATLGYTALWLPLILFAIHNQSKKQSWWNLLLLSVAISLSFFSGHFQISFYILGISLLFLIFKSFLYKNKKSVISLFFFFLLGILISLPQLLPSLHAYTQSFRSSAFSKGEIIPFQYLITIFAPDFFGNPVTRNDWFGHYAEWSSYIGVLPLLLAVYSSIGKKKKQIWFFCFIVVVGLLLATPTFLNDVLFSAKLPVLSTSSASRIIILVSFSLCVLSSFGLDDLIADWKMKSMRKIILFILSILSILLFFWIFILFKKPLDTEKLIVAKRNLMLPSLMALVACVLFLFGSIKKTFIRLFVLICLLGLVSFDMLRFVSKWMPFDPREYVYPKMAVIEELQKRVGVDRVVGNFGGEFSMMYGISSLEGYDAVYQERYGEFGTAISTGKIGTPERSIVRLDKHGKYSEEALALLGVRFVLHRLSDGRFGWTYPIWEYPNYHSVYKDNYYELFENTNSFPRAFLASSYTIITDKQRVIDELFSKNFDRKNSIILEREPLIKPQEGKGTVSIVRYTPTEIQFAVNTSSPKLLFLSDVFDSGWKAFIDGKSVPLYRADYDFRVVSVLEGNHKISMKYQPDNVTWGLRVSFVVLIFLLIGSLKELVYAYRHI